MSLGANGKTRLSALLTTTLQNAFTNGNGSGNGNSNSGGSELRSRRISMRTSPCMSSSSGGGGLEVNKTLPYDETLLRISVSLRSLEAVAKELSSSGDVSELNEIAWAVKALMLTDLTTLAGDDTAANVRRLCTQAAHPFPPHVIEAEFERELHDKVHAAAICVYPARIRDARNELVQLQMHERLKIAAVATGFPTGQYGLQSRLLEISQAVLAGANEIDIVINRQLALNADWEGVYKEVAAMRRTCADRAHLKTILAVGELGNMENVYRASMACMLAGADFIKTSTGKETVNATLPVGLVMIYAIREFRRRTCQLVGLKAAGGVRTVRDAIAWMSLVKETLGKDWLRPSLFRFGASGLLDDIARVLYENFEWANRERSQHQLTVQFSECK